MKNWEGTLREFLEAVGYDGGGIYCDGIPPQPYAPEEVSRIALRRYEIAMLRYEFDPGSILPRLWKDALLVDMGFFNISQRVTQYHIYKTNQKALVWEYTIEGYVAVFRRTEHPLVWSQLNKKNSVEGIRWAHAQFRGSST